MSSERNKETYRTLHDEIFEKRFNAVYPIRRYAHRQQYEAIVRLVPPGSSVLDAGCGEGVLSILLAERGCRVTGVDLSAPNIEAAKRYAAEKGLADRVSFCTGDAEHLPFGDRSFDVVVSSHVLEHLPDFVQGVREIRRVAKNAAVIAIPTCLNLSSMALLGRDTFWTISRRTPYAMVWGFLRVLAALLTGREGVNEGYAGNPDLIHIFRFPRRGKKLLEQGGLQIRKYCASSFPFPYIALLLPLSRLMEKLAWVPILRNFGYGTTYFCTVPSADV